MIISLPGVPNYITREGFLVLALILISSRSCGYMACGFNLGRYREAPCIRLKPFMLASQREDDNIKDTGEEFRKTASKLRQEAFELEKKLREGKESAGQGKEQGRDSVPLPPKYSDVRDSVWTISYLFASEPQPKNANEQEIIKTTRYGGKLTLHFKPDGYTDVISHESDGSLDILKAWGWDLETSNDDGNEYIVFSIDALGAGGSKQRFYMQAKSETDAGEITLSGGTVTVKQDVTETGSRWGLFSPKGILAEFRYVGDFIARPATINL